MNHVKTPLRAAALASLIVAPSLTAQVIVNETFDYADQAALAARWNTNTTPGNSTLVLNTSAGNPSPSVTNPGTTTTPNIWRGSTFSLTPSDTSPIRLTGDIISDGLSGSVTTIGLRTGANPLFEMGLYRSFDNTQTGPDSSTPFLPANERGIGVRTLSIGQDLNGQDWVKMGDYYTGSARFEATISGMSVTTRIDVGIDGTWDFTYTETGTTPIGAFSDLRIHAPATTASGTFGAIVDNVRLEVIPEPSTYALFGLGGLLFAALRRRKA